MFRNAGMMITVDHQAKNSDYIKTNALVPSPYDKFDKRIQKCRMSGNIDSCLSGGSVWSVCLLILSS
jgi:hypothetical protein